MNVSESAAAPAASIVEQVIENKTDPVSSAASAAQDPQAAPAEAAPKDPKDDDFAKRFATLSRKQKAIYEREQALRSRETMIERAERLDKLLKENPIAWAQESGVDLNQLLERMAKHGDEPSIDEKVKELEAKLAAKEKAEEEAKKKAEESKKSESEQKIIAEFKDEIKLFIEKDTAKFETIIAENAFEDVFDVCQLYFAEHRQILPIEQAAEEVENYLFERAKRLSGLKKLNAQAPQSLEPNRQDQTNHQTPGSHTLNSKITPEPSVPHSGRISREESLKKAAQKLRWT